MTQRRKGAGVLWSGNQYFARTWPLVRHLRLIIIDDIEKGSGSKAETPFHKISKMFYYFMEMCSSISEGRGDYFPRRAFSRST